MVSQPGAGAHPVASLRQGMLVGPLLALITLLLLFLLGPSITDAVLLVAVAWPTVGALLLALVAGRADPARRSAWLWAALGCAVGTVVAIALIVAVIAGFGYLLSDPGGSPR